MIGIAAEKTGGSTDELYAKFVSSRAYLDAIAAKNNADARQQSFAGLRALLFLLERAGVDPTTAALARAGGKPYFVGGGLQFNLSHSGELAVCALSDTPVGIDVELVRPKNNLAAFAERFFAPAERSRMAAADDPTAAFFGIWTRKEAYLKYDGRGVDCNLAGIDTTALTIRTFGLSCGGHLYIVSVCGEGDTEFVAGSTDVRVQPCAF